MGKRRRGVVYVAIVAVVFAASAVPAFSQTAAQVSDAAAAKSGSTDEVSLLRRQVAEQQKEIEALQVTMQAMKEKLEQGVSAAQSASPQAPNLGQVASTTPVIPAGPAVASRVRSRPIPAARWTGLDRQARLRRAIGIDHFSQQMSSHPGESEIGAASDIEDAKGRRGIAALNRRPVAVDGQLVAAVGTNLGQAVEKTISGNEGVCSVSSQFNGIILAVAVSGSNRANESRDVAIGNTGRQRLRAANEQSSSE